jgi:hypothetical protein
MKWVLLIGVVIALSMVSCSGTSSPAISQPTATKQTDSQPLSAHVLYQAFQDSKATAESTYKGKWVTVTGIFDSVGPDMLGTPYLILTDGGINAVWEVQCEMSSNNTVPLSHISKGQTVTVYGQCDTSYYPGNVFLNNCILK